ncbi:MAG: ATP-dependent Clp protease adaptor ClpS [Spirochaetia bacterium]|nr:ATP-dependent Clp protease adaptor ClpS [Spirochaetia bacterium]
MRENPHFQYDRKPQYVSDEIFKVIILDNDYNTYQEVIDICMEALNISFEEGMKIALAVDNNGFAEVLHAPKNEAEKTANVIRKIGIEVQVIPVS